MNLQFLSVIFAFTCALINADPVNHGAYQLIRTLLSGIAIPRPVINCLDNINVGVASRCQYQAWSDWSIDHQQQIVGRIAYSTAKDFARYPINADGSYRFNGESINHVTSEVSVWDDRSGSKSNRLECCSLWQTLDCIGELVKSMCTPEANKFWNDLLMSDARMGPKSVRRFVCQNYTYDGNECQIDMPKPAVVCAEKVLKNDSCEGSVDVSRLIVQKVKPVDITRQLVKVDCCGQWKSFKCHLDAAKKSCGLNEYTLFVEIVDKIKDYGKCGKGFKYLDHDKLCKLIG